MGAAQPAVVPAERRVHVRVREIFAEAIELIPPILRPQRDLVRRPLGHFAQRMLRERYPDLTTEEIYVLVTAAKRVYTAERKARSVA